MPATEAAVGAGTGRRRETPTVQVGGIPIGSEHPIVVQSMTNTDTADARGTARQVAELARAGSELVRITVNTLEAARSIAPGMPIHAVMGGFHLLNQTDEQVAWSGEKMHEFGVQHLIGAHCTGVNAVAGLREAAGLTRETSVVGSVGTVFTLEEGIRAGALNR